MSDLPESAYLGTLPAQVQITNDLIAANWETIKMIHNNTCCGAKESSPTTEYNFILPGGERARLNLGRYLSVREIDLFEELFKKIPLALLFSRDNVTGSLYCNQAIAGVTQEDKQIGGTRFFVCESTSFSGAKRIAELLGGVLV